jgi:hypothetical protein
MIDEGAFGSRCRTGHGAVLLAGDPLSKQEELTELAVESRSRGGRRCDVEGVALRSR